MSVHKGSLYQDFTIPLTEYVLTFCVGLQVHLGANAIMQLQRLHLGLKVDTNGSHTEVNRAHVAETPETVLKESGGGNADGILAKCKPLDETIIENGAFRPRDNATRTGLLSAKPSVRGGRKMEEECSQEEVDGIKSGGSSDSGGKKFIPSGKDQVRKKGWGHKRQDVDQNEDIWGTRRGQKSEPWCHDDRFTRENDFYGKQAQRGEETFRPRIVGGASGFWRDRRGSEGRDQKSTPKSETSKIEPQPIAVPPPPLPEEENWD